MLDETPQAIKDKVKSYVNELLNNKNKIMYTREQIRENRVKFAKGLQESHREKETGRLEARDDENKRCCLGHGCDIFNIKRNVIDETETTNKKIYFGEEEEQTVAPQELIDLLGLFNQRGGSSNGKSRLHGSEDNDDFELHNGRNSLTTLNDTTDITIQEVGVLIEGWIEGGEGTPFFPLSSYPETLEQ